MQELLQALLELGGDLVRLLGIVTRLVLSHALAIAWVTWWLWLVDWRRFWPALARGAWMPLVLVLGLVSFLAWHLQATMLGEWGSHWLTPLVLTVLLVLSVLVCGWLQTFFAWYPAEITLETTPAAVVHHGNHHTGAEDGH